MVVCGARKEEKIGPFGPHAVPNFKPAAKGLEQSLASDVQGRYKKQPWSLEYK